MKKYRVPYELVTQEPEQWGGAFLRLAGKPAAGGVAGLVLSVIFEINTVTKTILWKTR